MKDDSEPQATRDRTKDLADQESPAAKDKEILDEWDDEDKEAEAEPQAEQKKRLRRTEDAEWRGLSKVESKSVGTNFSTDLIERTDRTIRDYEKSEIRLTKRRLFEEGLAEQLDALNSTVKIDEALEEAEFLIFFDIDDILGYLKEEVKDWVWTGERIEYLLDKLKGESDLIDEFFRKVPQARELVEAATIERAKKPTKPAERKKAKAKETVEEETEEE